MHCKLKFIPIAFIVVLICLALDAAGQEKLLTGIVTDGHRNRLIGINVMIKGTTVGVVTNMCGQFALPVKADEVTLIFHGMSYNDMRTFEIKLKKTQISTDTLVFQLGHLKFSNENCGKVSRRIKRFVIE